MLKNVLQTAMGCCTECIEKCLSIEKLLFFFCGLKPHVSIHFRFVGVPVANRKQMYDQTILPIMFEKSD